MSNLNDIINLAKADGGKFFVIDQDGEVKLVIMNVEDYQRLLLGKLQRQILDVEKINREITMAQLQDREIPSPLVEVPRPPKPVGPKVEQAKQSPPSVDLRAEVIDPSFNFEGPKAEFDDL